MDTGRPNTLINLLQNLLDEKDNSLKGDIQLAIGKEVVKFDLIDGNDTQNAFYMMMVKHSVNEYLQSNCSEEKAQQVKTTIEELNKTTVHLR